MMRAAYFLIAFMCAFIANTLSYGEDKSEVLSQKEEIPEWRGNYSGFQEPEVMIIRSQDRFQKILSGIGLTPADIDFSRHMAIAIFMGKQMTGGYGINILRAEEMGRLELLQLPDSGIWNPSVDEVRQLHSIVCSKRNVFVVEYEEVSPGPGLIVTQALTTPYFIKVVKRSDLPAVFVRYAK